MPFDPPDEVAKFSASQLGKRALGKPKTISPERRAALAEHMRRIGLANRGKRRAEQVTPTEPETPAP